MAGETYLEGAWDIHVHASPSLFPRWGDALDLADEISQTSMSGFVLKYHHGSSVEAAYLTNKIHGDLKIFGGVTLNYPVGGLNPHAVDTAIALGAKFVWLPTIHAANHGSVFGMLGGFHFQKSDTELHIERGITILNEQGEIESSLKEILDLIHDKSVILATGHISPHEIYELKKYIESEKLEIPLLLNHVLFKTSELKAEQINELAGDNVWIETVYLTVSPMVDPVPVHKVAEIMRKTDDAKWIIASDSGQEHNIKSPHALSKYAEMLVEQGMEEKRIVRMLKDEPYLLLHSD